MVEDLADSEKALCGKNEDEALQWKQKGNRCFATGDYSNALASYSQVLLQLSAITSEWKLVKFKGLFQYMI